MKKYLLLLPLAVPQAFAASYDRLSQQEVIKKGNALQSDPSFMMVSPYDFNNYIEGEVAYFMFDDRDKLLKAIDGVHSQQYKSGYKVKYYVQLNSNNSNYLVFALTRDDSATMCPGENKVKDFDNSIKVTTTTPRGSKVSYTTVLINDYEKFSKDFYCSSVNINTVKDQSSTAFVQNGDFLSRSAKFVAVKNQSYVSKDAFLFYYDETAYQNMGYLVNNVNAMRNVPNKAIPYFYETVYNSLKQVYALKYYIYVPLNDTCMNSSIVNDFNKKYSYFYKTTPYKINASFDDLSTFINYYAGCNPKAVPAF
jgi:hypothetical protein